MSRGRPHRVVVVPSAPGLLASYAGLVDPLAEVRRAAVDAVRWLVSGTTERVVVLGAGPDPANLPRGVREPLSLRVARALLDDAGVDLPVVEATLPDAVPALSERDGLLVVADGSAKGDERAPGHIDERAFGYDEAIEAALGKADTAALRDLDAALGEELLAAGVPALRALGALVQGPCRAETDYADDPFGVRYWVVRWQCES